MSSDDISREDKKYVLNVLNVLKKLQKADKSLWTSGICKAFSEPHFGIPAKEKLLLDYLETVWVHWPNYSGSIEYPVPATGGISPEYTYYHTIYVWIGEYGKLRIELLNFLIREITKDIKAARV